RYGPRARDHAPPRHAPPRFDPRRERARSRLHVQGAAADRQHRRSTVAQAHARPEEGAVTSIAGRLLRRLLAIQVATHVLSFLLSGIFAPRVLLLQENAAEASLVVVG